MIEPYELESTSFKNTECCKIFSHFSHSTTKKHISSDGGSYETDRKAWGRWWGNRRLLGSGSSDSDSDSDDGTGHNGDKCLPNGDELTFVDDQCQDDNGWDSDSSDKWNDKDPSEDGFLYPICVTYNVTDLVPDEDCGEINSIFLGLCTDDDHTDFDPDLLGIDDITNI